MRLVFGVLSLLVVLAIVGSLGKKQLQALSGSRASPASASTADAAVSPAPHIQQQVRQDTVRALQQGADRNARADP